MWRRLFAVFLVGGAGGPIAALLGSGSSGLVGLGAVFGGAVAASMMVWPFWALLLTVVTVPIERIGRLTNDASQYTFSVMRIMGALTLCSLLLHAALVRKRIRLSSPVILYGVYILFGAISLTYTTDWFDGIRQWPAFVGNLVFFFLIPNLVRTLGQVRLLIVAWLVVTGLIGAYTIYGWRQGVAVTDSRFHSTGERVTEERFAVVLQDQAEFDLDANIPRALGPTSHPAVYAINNLMALPFFAYFLAPGKAVKWRVLAALGGVISMYNVLLTNTRAAVVAMLFISFLVVLFRVVLFRWKLAVASLILAALAVPLMPSALYERIFRLDNYTTQRSATLAARLLYWQAAWTAFTDHPLVGVGLGNQSEIPKRVKQIHTPPNSTAHCEYLYTLMEVGILGFSVLAAFFILIYQKCRAAERTYRALGDHETARLLAAAQVLFWGVLFYAIQVDCFHFPLKGWWLIMGLILALHELAQTAKRSPSPQGALSMAARD